MEQITGRLPGELLAELEAEADEAGVSRSEYIRDVLRTREHTDALRDRIADKEARIDQLEAQLARRSQVQQQIEALPDKLRETQQSYQERRQRLLDEASLAQRLKWKLTGVPVGQGVNGQQ
jgi:metal-responsive CopG/Arc/MetJ family transcriptional regulator